jgi:hypothetical protein
MKKSKPKQYASRTVKLNRMRLAGLLYSLFGCPFFYFKASPEVIRLKAFKLKFLLCLKNDVSSQ